MVKQAAIKTADGAGDGTTTSTLLAREMVKAGLSHLNNDANAVEIKRGIDVAVKQVVKSIRENAEEITSEEQLEQIATISANNDPEVGKLIATAMDKVGNKTFNGWEEQQDGQAISREMFITPLINAVQELSATVTTLQQEIKILKEGL